MLGAMVMAIPINIDDLVNLKVIESARVEFKANWNPEPCLHTICAFVNDIDNWGGGYVVLGIKAQGGAPCLPVAGITKGSIDKINRELLNICNLIEPRYIPVTEHVMFGGKDLFVIWIPGGKNRPYKCPDARRTIGRFLISKRETGIMLLGSKKPDKIRLFATSRT